MARKKITGQGSLLDFLLSLHTDTIKVIETDKSDKDDYSVFEAMLNGLLCFKAETKTWRGLLAIPPASLLEAVIQEFDKRTTVPLEIPLMCLHHYIAGYLLYNNIYVKDGRRKIYTDIWTQVLADSGEGKTYSFTELGKSMPDLALCAYNISAPESSSAFFDILQEHNCKLLFRDEWWSMLDKMQSGKSLDGCKDYMMRAFNHETIERLTKKDGLKRIENAKFSFIGISTAKPVLKRLSDEDLVSGFSARFNYIFADILDEDKIIAKFNIDRERLLSKWTDIKEKISFTEYKPAKGADRAFEDTMIFFMHSRSKDIGRGIVRRTVESAHKYALIYHILRGKGDEQFISAEDYGWAARMIWLHIADLKRLMNEWGGNEYEKLLSSCRKTIENFKTKYGRDITSRELLMRQRKLRDTDQAKKVLSLLLSCDDSKLIKPEDERSEIRKQSQSLS